MKTGVTVERRDQVLIGLRLPAFWATSTLVIKDGSTKNPFLRERDIVEYQLRLGLLRLPAITADDDLGVRNLGLLARREMLRELTPR